MTSYGLRPRYKGEVVPSLKLMEGKLVAVKEALAVLDKRCGEISDQREVIEADIHDTFEQLQETLNVRKTKLIGQFRTTPGNAQRQEDQANQPVTSNHSEKVESLAVQTDQMETILTQLNSCLDFVRESLKTNSQGEVLMMKSGVWRQQWLERSLLPSCNLW